MAGAEWAMGEYNVMRVEMEGSRSLKKVKGGVGGVCILESWRKSLDFIQSANGSQRRVLSSMGCF